MDALVRAGIELNRTYAYKFCSPTRSSLQSGRLPTHVNVVNANPDIHNAQDPISGFAAIPRERGSSVRRIARYCANPVGVRPAGAMLPSVLTLHISPVYPCSCEPVR